MDYGLHQNRLSPQYQFGPMGATYTWGFYDASHLISNATNQNYTRSYYWTVDLVTGIVDTLIEFTKITGYGILGLTKYYDDCNSLYYFGPAGSWIKNDVNFKGFFGKIDFEKGTLDKICIGKRSETFIGLESTDNFRHNGYLIDLDADNSTGHMTGGFYDTLTICDPVGRIADEDISYRICDEVIDSISFRIKSFGEPGPLDESIMASETLRRTGEKRSLGLKRYHTICRGTEIAGLARIPHQDFDSILWWNGDTTRQTEIQQDDHGALWVQAMKDGCVYRDTLSLLETSGGILHEDWFSDTLLLCKGTGIYLQVSRLDSLLMYGKMYYSGDSILFLYEGNIDL